MALFYLVYRLGIEVSKDAIKIENNCADHEAIVPEKTML